ncbi:MAG: DNA polymerase III subunit epsilon [Nitratireductor sp.]|nr:DNA polymerase III subunit epsilon [Nitratireductor sp.]
MREIIFDTETTGLRPEEGERVIEIGAVEFVNRTATGRTFHHYINPEGRKVDPGAYAVHGISNEQLADKPSFADLAEEFLEFIDGADLVAHNAAFDINFINHEFARIGIAPVDPGRVVDTLTIARRKHPMAQNSLDRLCERYGIDNRHRTLHGALLDAQLLAEVYIELLGGKQAAFDLTVEQDAGPSATAHFQDIDGATLKRPAPLANRLTEAERKAHRAMVDGLGEKAIWRGYS